MTQQSLAAKIQLDDAEIIGRILAGEKDLYEVIMRKYNQRLFRISRGYVHDDDEAEEIMQEAYVKAYEELSRFEGRAKFSTWLTRILLNQALYHVRQKRKFFSLSVSASRPEKPAGPAAVYELRAPAAESPIRTTMNAELKNALEDAINTLPEKYRSVFIMREIEQMSTAETSACLEITEVNVKVRLNRAKEMLREVLSGFYQKGEVLHFELTRCDRIVEGVMARIDSRYS